MALRRSLWSADIILIVAITTFVSAQDTTAFRVVRPGVRYLQVIDHAGPWVINVLEIDLRQKDLALRSVKGLDRVKGREETSSMAARSEDSLTRVVAGVNADFFESDGEPINNQVAQGTVVRTVSPRQVNPGDVNRPRSQFAVTVDGSVHVGNYRFFGQIIWSDGSSSSLSRVNAPPDSGTWAMYNWFSGEQTPHDSLPSSDSEIPLRALGERGDTLVYVVVGPAVQAGGVTIPRRGAVLTRGRGYSLGTLIREGDTVRVVVCFDPQDQPLQTLVGGMPRMVIDSSNVAGDERFMEGLPPRFSSTRNPRTGIGISCDGKRVWMVTVDGRQTFSVGMSLPEFADLLLKLGACQAINLDGGGSTTMVLEGQIVNYPSDQTGERSVGNCLLLVARR
jgi:exopolysaccharide biosynthesis protein